MKRPIFKRVAENPILTSQDMPFRAAAVLNPGATEQGDDVVLLVRVENDAGFSDIHVARSPNGITGWRLESEPILQHGLPDMRYEEWGCEDARVVFLAEENCWYITYTAYSPAGAAVAIARSRDLHTADRLGLIFSPNNKDAALFPHRFHGRWAVLHRPDAGGGVENIWLAYSPDLIHWGEPHCVLQEGSGPAWDAAKVGSGPPPIETEDGWLLLYHGVKHYAGEMVYRVGAALLDYDRPHKVKARTKHCIFQTETPYERSGFIHNVVFPTGIIQRDEQIWMYYGAADTAICLAKARLSDVVAALYET
jgi:predicted GH43/DUF377 family glycosyl hydrolase